MTAFISSRRDGRSDRRVIYELVQEAVPDTTFAYEALITELQAGVATQIDRPRVYRAITAANKVLLTERQRYLFNVRDVGYRVIPANEHLPVALIHKDRSNRQIQRGLELLRKVRFHELDENQRTLHEAELLIMSGLSQAIDHSHNRHDRLERLFNELSTKVENITRGEE